MKLNIMITAVGSAIGNGIIKSIKLSNLDCNIITTETQPYAVGLYRGKAGYLVPLAKSPNFIDKIIKTCNEENVHCICIGTDYELLKFAENKKRIEKETNAKVIVSSPEIIKIADDKWLTHKFLVENKLPYIPSALHQDVNRLLNQEDFPFIIKPRIGDSSKDVFIVKNKEELHEKLSFLLDKEEKNEFLSEESKPIIQKYMGDPSEEYTTTTLAFDGKCYGLLSMKREMKFPGHTTKAVIQDFPNVNKRIKQIVEKLNPLGPCNFQSRLIKDIPMIFEINCRFSGTTPFCAQVGFNTVEAVIKHYILNEKIPDLTNYKKGVILRYFNEIFIPKNEINNIKKYGKILNSNSKINKTF